MEKLLDKLLIPAIYVALVIGNAGALNANMRGEFSDLDQNPMHARRDFAMSIGFSLFPPAWIVTPFVTGFYYYGWTLEYKAVPCTADYPEIWCGKPRT